MAIVRKLVWLPEQWLAVSWVWSVFVASALHSLTRALYLCRRDAVRSNPAYVRQGYTTQTSLASSIFQPGLFTGYALIDGVPRGAHTMALSFFPQAGHVVHGKGVDRLGPFVVTGMYSPDTLRMGFDKIYQGGSAGNNGNGPKETIQVEWSPNERVFRGNSYSSNGTRRQQHEFILRRKGRWRQTQEDMKTNIHSRDLFFMFIQPFRCTCAQGKSFTALLTQFYMIF